MTDIFDDVRIIFDEVLREVSKDGIDVKEYINSLTNWELLQLLSRAGVVIEDKS